MKNHRGLVEGPQSAPRMGTALSAGLVLCGLLFYLAASGCGSPSSSPPPMFTTIDAPGAGNQSGLGTSAEDINAGGDIAGSFTDSNEIYHGFTRNAAGVLTAFDAPGVGSQAGDATQGFGINSVGTVAGFFFSDSQHFEHGYIRATDGSFTVFDPPGSLGTTAQSINDTGTVAGGFNDPNGFHGFVRASDGTITTFDVPGFASSQVEFLMSSRINAGGAVVGFFLDSDIASHGFLRAADGTVTVLDAPGAGAVAGTGTQATDINASGVVVGGLSGVAAGPSHSFLRAADGTYTVFDPPEAGSKGSTARGINDSGAIIGTYIDASLVQHGYLRSPDGTFVTLDDPSAAQLPVSLTSIGTVPIRINASGAIVGDFTDSSGARHGFVRE